MKCDEVFVRPKEDKNWLEVRDFLVDATAPTTLIVRLDIKITGMYVQDREWGIYKYSPFPLHSIVYTFPRQVKRLNPPGLAAGFPVVQKNCYITTNSHNVQQAVKVVGKQHLCVFMKMGCQNLLPHI